MNVWHRMYHAYTLLLFLRSTASLRPLGLRLQQRLRNDRMDVLAARHARVDELCARA
jgi:hypothetical protein